MANSVWCLCSRLSLRVCLFVGGCNRVTLFLNLPFEFLAINYICLGSKLLTCVFFKCFCLISSWQSVQLHQRNALLLLVYRLKWQDNNNQTEPQRIVLNEPEKHIFVDVCIHGWQGLVWLFYRIFLQRGIFGFSQSQRKFTMLMMQF